MNLFAGNALYFLAIGLVVLMAYQGIRQRVPLLSLRNLYFVGFIVYQLVDPATILVTGESVVFHPQDLSKAGTKYLVYCIVFLSFFLLFYKYNRPASWMSHKLSAVPCEIGDVHALVAALFLIAVAVVLRFLLPPIPVISVVAYHVATGLSAVATGFVGWVWAKRRFNALVLVLGITVCLLAIIIVFQSFSRRPLISVTLGLSWGAYYCLAGRISPTKILLWSVPPVTLAFVVVCAFSATRIHSTYQFTTQERINSLIKVDAQDLLEGAVRVLSGQEVGSASLWIMENYPKAQEPNHLSSLGRLFIHYIPRSWWPEKPKSLANEIARIANTREVSWNIHTAPPGVIGYAGAEGGMYAVVVYALFFATMVRLFDELNIRNVNNPFIVLSVGCVTGHFVGLARGDLTNFTFNIIVTFVIVMLLMKVLQKAFGVPFQYQRVSRYAAQA